MKNWKEQLKLPEKPTGMAYGFIPKWSDNPIPCDKATLMTTLETNRNIQYVTTPAHDAFIIPGTDYETLQPLLKVKKSTLKRNLWFSAFFTLMFGLVFFNTDSPPEKPWYNDPSFISILVIGILPLFKTLYELIVIKNIDKNNFSAEASWVKFYYWLTRKIAIPIFVITGIFIAIALLQHKVGMQPSLELVGLTQTSFLEGEYWRILTVNLLHTNLIFLIFNVSLIFAMGHLIHKIAGFSYLAIVFLISGLVGNLLGFYLSPNITTAGALTGIMGLVGFILVLSFRFREHIPRRITEAMLYIIAIVPICNLGFIDIEPVSYIAQVGGLISGMLLGLLFFQGRKHTTPHQPSSAIKMLGDVATLILLAGVILIVYQLS